MSDRESAHVVVVGAGVIGLAVARALAQTCRDVLILEANSGFGMETSSRNSEVIHGGLYYPQGSLKAQTCVRGRQLLYDYAALRGIEVLTSFEGMSIPIGVSPDEYAVEEPTRPGTGVHGIPQVPK